MSHILKALRKSQMERDLGKVPSLEVPYQAEPEKAPRRWWPWVLALALLGNLGIMAAYAWEYVIPGSGGGGAPSRAEDAIDLKLPPSAAGPAIPGPEQLGPAGRTAASPSERPAVPRSAQLNAAVDGDAAGRGAEETGEMLDQAALVEAFQLVPAEGDAPVRAPGPEPSPALSAAHAAAPAPDTGGNMGPGQRALAAPSLDDPPPSAEPAPPAAHQIARLPPSQSIAAAPSEPLPPLPRRRPVDTAWSSTPAAAGHSQTAALAPAGAPAPLPPLTETEEVARVAVVPPQETPEPGPPSGEAAAPRLQKTLGEVEGRTGERSAELPRFEQLPRELRAEMPQIKLSAHVFDPDPQRRFARINKEKFREGDEIAEGLWLDSVTTEGIVLRYADTRFWMGSF